MGAGAWFKLAGLRGGERLCGDGAVAGGLPADMDGLPERLEAVAGCGKDGEYVEGGCIGGDTVAPDSGGVTGRLELDVSGCPMRDSS